MNFRRAILVLASAALTTAAPIASAQAWPKGPVRVVVPFDAGSTPDQVARVVSDRLAARLGQPLVVENKSGAAGNIGTDAVAKATPDGQTIGVSIAGPLAVNPLLFKRMPYDPARDLEMLTVAVSQPSVLVVAFKHSVSSPKELLNLMKGSRPSLSFASIGAGSVSHLAMETLAAGTGADVVHVPYRGSGAAVTAVLSGEVDMALLPAAAVMPHVKAGKMRALAVASAKRSASLPDLPTLAESGLPDVQADAWIGFIAPAKTPAAIVNKLHEQITQVLAEPAVKDKLRSQYMDVVGNTPTEFRALLAADMTRWKPVIQKHNIQLD
ncbi:MAG TPA: tripartite tricarboxylate transporter substrate binding protein [Burkholderiaceae bacterium]|nr:tripartite tricarboxylate transporter substrate binding protein [Burkholderiaceae bacterium]